MSFKMPLKSIAASTSMEHVCSNDTFRHRTIRTMMMMYHALH